MEEFDFPEMDPNRIITEDNPMFYVILNASELNKIKNLACRHIVVN